MKIAIFQFSLFGINSYVVYDPETRNCAVIDPGMSDENEEKALEKFISEHNLTVTHIINTHLHIDHAVGNFFMKKKYPQAKIVADKNDMYLGENMKGQAKMFGLNPEIEDIEITEYIKDGDKIKIGNGTLDVISVPGHSKGSIALYDPQDHFVIVGDALFKGSIGRTDLPGGNTLQLLEAIRKNLFTLPDETVVFPGHGPYTTIGEEKRTNPFLH